VAVIMMNGFAIEPMFAPPTKSSSEILFHRLRGHPIVNTSGKKDRGRAVSELGWPEDQTGYGVCRCLQEGKQLACLAW